MDISLAPRDLSHPRHTRGAPPAAAHTGPTQHHAIVQSHPHPGQIQRSTPHHPQPRTSGRPSTPARRNEGPFVFVPVPPAAVVWPRARARQTAKPSGARARPSATRCRGALSRAPSPIPSVPAGCGGEARAGRVARCWRMRRRVARIHRPSRRRSRRSPGVVGTRSRRSYFLGARAGRRHQPREHRHMFSLAARASTASSIVAGLPTPAPPSKSGSAASARPRPRLIMYKPVSATANAVVGMDPVERLKSGFEKFKTEVYDKKPELFEPLKHGQTPKYMVFACSDSRCCPSVTLGLQPGEAFTVRNIAAMVPPYDKNKYTGIGSAIEYAVCALKVEVLTVIGHSRCGGIKALLSLQDGAADTFHFVEDWVRIGFLAKKKVLAQHPSAPFDDQCSILEKEAVNVSLLNLLTYPWVKEGVAKGTLKLVGARYDFVNGVFDTWEK